MDFKKFFQETDLFAKHCGMELLEVEPGYAKGRMKIEGFLLNGVQIVHGGAIFTLADFVFAAASNARGTVAVAINGNIQFIKAVSEGYLYAEAKENALNPKLGNYTVNITNEKNEIIAIFQGMVYRKKAKTGDL